MNQLWFPEHHLSANGISLRPGEVQMKIYNRSLQALLSSPLAHSHVLARLALFAQIGELACRLFRGHPCRTEKSVPWIEVSPATECRLGNGLLIIWPTKDLFKFWNLLQLSFFKQLHKKHFSLTNFCIVVPTSAVHQFSFTWDIVHVVKAAIIVISVHFNLSTLFMVSHVLSAKVSPEWR